MNYRILSITRGFQAAGLALLLLVTVACETAGQGTAAGALSGAALGGGAGALLSEGDSGRGALIGGVGGALAGGLIGHQMGSMNQTNREQDMAINQALQDANTQIINVPTNTGGYVPVRLVRQGTVWVGPRGESYPSLPTPQQLRPAYGF